MREMGYDCLQATANWTIKLTINYEYPNRNRKLKFFVDFDRYRAIF